MTLTDDQIESAFQQLGLGLTADEVILTAETLDDFLVATAYYHHCGSIERTANTLTIEGVQVRKQDKRRTLRVVDFGDQRGVNFG